MKTGKLAGISAMALTVAFAWMSGASAQNNVVLIDQTVTLGSELGNTLIVDQSGASNSLIAGAPSGQDFNTLLAGSASTPEVGRTIDIFNASAPATQVGSGNSADITLTGDNVTAGLNQDGDGNNATISVSGDRAFGSVFQDGNNNDAELIVSSLDARGELIQIGNDNETQLSVTGNSNAVISFTVQGNGVTTTVPASVVSSSGGQVTIIQRQLNSFSSR